MRKALYILLIMFFLSSGFWANINFTKAQAEVEISELEIEKIEPQLQAVAGEDRNVIVDRQISFSALSSVVTAVENVKYIWDFGDGQIATGEEVIHVYPTSGVYRVKLKIIAKAEGEKLESEDEIIVNVDKDVIVLISDQTLKQEQFTELQSIASTQGILIVNIQETGEGVDYVIENDLAQKILKSRQDITQASSVVIWTDRNIGLNALLEAAQFLNRDSEGTGQSLAQFGFNNKYLVVVTEQNFASISRVAQSLYNLLNPQFLILTSDEAKPYIFSQVQVQGLLEKIRQYGIDHRLLGVHTARNISEIRPWNFMSFLVGYMVDKGMPVNTIYLILVLPLIATVIAFSRQIIGFKALGIYTPSIIAVSFLVTGLKYGLIIFAVTLIVGTLSRLVARKIRLSYLPRMANVLISVCLAIFIIFLMGAIFNKQGLIEISVFPILIMVLLTENFVYVQIEKGSKQAVILVLETLLLSIICYWLASWETLRTFIIAFPEYIILTIIINFIMGKWTGLRIMEFYRFRKVIKNVEVTEKK